MFCTGCLYSVFACLLVMYFNVDTVVFFACVCKEGCVGVPLILLLLSVQTLHLQ